MLLRVLLMIIYVSNVGVEGEIFINETPLSYFGDTSSNVATEILIGGIVSGKDKSNVVLISDTSLILSNVASRIFNKEMIEITSFDTDHLTSEAIKSIKWQNLKSNLRSVYLIVWSPTTEQSEILKVIQIVKSFDYFSQIVIVSLVITNGKEFLYSYPIYDVHIFIPNIKYTKFTSFSKCRFCNNGNDLVEIANSWAINEGFSHSLEFEESFKNNFFGAAYIMCFQNGYLMWKTGVDQLGNDIHGGLGYEYFVIHGGMFNVSWKFKDIGKGCRGAIYGIERIWSFEAFYFYDYSASTIYSEGNTIISVEPLKGMDWKGIIKPFDLVTWILLLSSVPVCSLALYYLRLYTTEPAQSTSRARAFWDILVILLWDSIRSPYPSLGVIILFSVYLLVIQLLIGLYLGEYTGIIVSPNYLKPPIDTFEQWLDGTMTWTNCQETSVEFITEVLLKEYPEMDARYLPCTETEGWRASNKSLHLLLNNPNGLVYFGPKSGVQHLIDRKQIGFKQGRKFHFAKTIFYTGYANLLLSHNTFLKEVVNRKIMLFHAMGLRKPIDPFFDMAEHIKWKLKEAEFFPEEIMLIRFKHFSLGLYVLGVGLVISLLVCISEILYETLMIGVF